MTEDFLRPVWAEISLPSIRKNLLKIRETVQDPTLPGEVTPAILFVIKADAYGHGAQEIARYCQDERLCCGFGVSSVEEGVALRRAGIILDILILGSLYPFESFVKAIRNNLIVTVASVDGASQLAAAAHAALPRRALAHKARCHIKLETGMGRIGVRRPGAVKIFKELSKGGGVDAQGLYTHLSSADSDPDFTRQQLKHFSDTVDECVKSGTNPGIKHAANSFAAVNYPESRWDMVRPGLAAYGLMEGFEPALALKSRIVFLKDIPSGSSVGYNRTFKSARPMRIATLPCGYADGYSRRLSNRGDVLVRGKRCRILGTVTMDMTMIDVTDAGGVSVGDEAVLCGRQGNKEITVGDLAALTGTIPYEVVCSIASRVPRIYIK